MDCSLFQTKEWEEFKLRTGYQKSYWIEGVLVLQKKLPLGRTMLYSPMVSQAQLDKIQDTRYKLQKFFFKIMKISRKEKSIFFRLELNIPKMENGKWKMENFKGFVKSFEEMQPEHNWLVDVTIPEEEIKAQMKQKGRYNLKIAQKNNIKIVSTNKIDRNLDVFFNQYENTGKRHNVSYRSKKYFEALLEIFGQKDYARVYTAYSSNNIPLASAIVLFYGESALYLYGGSSDTNKNLMAPYLLHWQIILDAKKRNLKEYNFLGIAPDEEKNHPWAGITRFKKQFGGYQIDILGCYDLILHPLEYKLFKIAEKIRRR